MHSSDHPFANIGQIEPLNIKGIPISAQMAESFTALESIAVLAGRRHHKIQRFTKR